jgi:hypothetical protein
MNFLKQYKKISSMEKISVKAKLNAMKGILNIDFGYYSF